MARLSPDERAFFRENGYLMVEDAVDAALLARLQREFEAWVEESRGHDAAWGDTLDGRPRFDVEPGHSAEAPKLRRVNAPIEVSDAYYAATMDSRMVDCVADLIGPDVKLHHTKINSKLPGGHTEVKWHQDFPFTPHTNDDVVTALLMVDEVTETNGALEVLPASHRGPIHGLWHDGVFTGAVSDDVTAACRPSASPLHRPGGRGMPDAHAPAARLRAQPVRPAANPAYLGLQRGRRDTLLAEPHADPLPGASRSRPADRPGPFDRLRDRSAATADDRLFLRPASPSRRAGRRGPVTTPGRRRFDCRAAPLSKGIIANSHIFRLNPPPKIPI